MRFSQHFLISLISEVKYIDRYTDRQADMVIVIDIDV